MVIRTPSNLPPEVVFVVVAGYVGFFTLRAFIRFSHARKSLRWRPVDGVITQSMLEDQEYHGRYSRTRHRYRANIKYTYRIGSKELEGDRVYLGSNDWSGTETKPQQLVDMYRLGSKVRVYTDPARPDAPVLRRGERGPAWRDLLMAWGPILGLALVYVIMELAIKL